MSSRFFVFSALFASLRPIGFALFGLPLFAVLIAPFVAEAGVHYSGETFNDLPANWRGFLLDHRGLRMIGASPGSGIPTHVLRQQYLSLAEKLETQAKAKPLTADEAADLGALYVRLNRPAKAIDLLRPAAQAHPTHFRILSNLGTAWQLSGDLAAAERALREAVRVAPAAWKKMEEAQLKLVQSRQREGKNAAAGVDDLFGVAVSRETVKKLPADDVVTVQQLALWLPADGRLLWLLGELANAHGDVRTAASILDGVVGEFALASPEARLNRKQYREAADAVAKLSDAEHAKYRGDIAFKSARPLQREIDLTTLPEIRLDGTNEMPWPVLNETTIEKPFKPNFLKHLKQLDGKKVAITGYMQPLGMEFDVSGFMLLEYPVGCWFCETPEPAGIVFTDLGDGKTVTVRRNRVKVAGVLKLNSTDPEDFLYTITGAKVSDPD